MKRIFSHATLFVMLSLAGGWAMAQSESHESEAPADNDWVTQATQTCASCHGKNGVSQTPNFPVIAGQYQDYLLHALKAYRDGERSNPIMAGQVQGMSTGQLKALARYYSRQQTPLYTPTAD